ncbi:PhzF family phenazine biosynthesis protein [Pseudalkalibacillus salsuginis]|uniref:PhzF family phenazine biosynthesis protein n=1 Tax=Pseudalkalibacillus salsuginis TaxID=2910972 RepID=UPI001F1CCE70|nr:PhzF family phenazine biosynthesis protein [Pseudalkalibacillus salsuginis]MCF6409426.1 PhzF family phenazine biosynthesis protein [Pseudalkalibacillus salsuginis]
MKSIMVSHYDVFSKESNKGNPAGVVLNGDELTDIEMQEIAFKVGFNETAFPVKSEVSDFKIRFFTPGHEMNLCGHATLATVYALKTNGLLDDKTTFTIETKAGILPIRTSSTTESDLLITMQQASPKFEEFKGSKGSLAKSIGIKESDIDGNIPVLYGSTGTWTLLVPIKKLDSFKKMKPNNKEFLGILKEMPKASVHPFCLETYDSIADMHARHFSSPFSGTIEDAVTGTASGVMGAYYAKYINSNFKEFLNLIVEQGHEIGKDGRVMVQISKNGVSLDVKIAGNAVYVKGFEVLSEN